RVLVHHLDHPDPYAVLVAGLVVIVAEPVEVDQLVHAEEQRAVGKHVLERNRDPDRVRYHLVVLLSWCPARPRGHHLLNMFIMFRLASPTVDGASRPGFREHSLFGSADAGRIDVIEDAPDGRDVIRSRLDLSEMSRLSWSSCRDVLHREDDAERATTHRIVG